MTKCLSPLCVGEVITERATVGKCHHCDLHHTRPNGLSEWNEIVGPVDVTLSGLTIGTTTAPGNVATFRVDWVKVQRQAVSIPGPTAEVVNTTYNRDQLREIVPA